MNNQEAQTAIGQQGERDYLLDPTAHADLYKGSAPELAQLLRKGAVQAEATAFKQQDAAALAAQAKYKTWMSVTNWAILLASISGAFAIAAGAAPVGTVVSGLPITTLSKALFVVAAVCSLAATVGLYFIREGKLLEDWMTRRANAETHRLSYFMTVAKLAVEAKDTSVLNLALEYFRRYQFDVQRVFYTNRAAGHQSSAGRTILVGALGAGAAAIAGTISGILGAAGNGLSIIGTLTVVGSALGAFATAREAMNQDRRNAERYDRSHDALVGIASKLDDVRAGADAGNASAVTEFVALVNDQISLEHRQWLESSQYTKDAAARLDAALAKTQKPTTGDAH